MSNSLRDRIKAVWLDGPVPSGYWDRQEHRCLYMRWLGRRLGFRRPEDWYRITTDDVKRNRGGGLMKYQWNSSIITGVRECFPEYDWKDWLFQMCPRSYWKDPQHHRAYMDWLARQLGIRRPEDWYQVTNRDFTRHKGGAFLLHYDSTISKAVMAYLPEYDWKEWLFRKIPKGFWNDRRNRRRYVQWLGRKLGITRMDQWYAVTRHHIEGNHGNNLLKRFDGSPYQLLKDVYPRYDWKEWMFARVPYGFWRKRENRRRYMEWLGKRLRYRRPEDWYRIRRSDFLENFGGGFLASKPSYLTVLREHLPHLTWPRTADPQLA